MRIAVVGVGGVGGYFGGKLARHYAGDGSVEIVFIARGEHLDQIRRNGLTQITEAETFTVHPTVATDTPGELGLFDLTLVCVKRYGLESCAKLIKDNISENSVVISLLNGVDNVAPLAFGLPRTRVLNGCVYIGAHIVKPGVVRQAGGTCQLLFGPEDGNMEGLKEIETLLTNANINAALKEDITAVVWGKYLFVSPLASATTYLKQPIGAFVENTDKRTFLEGLMREVADVGRAKGIEISEDMIQDALAKNSLFPYDTKTSMQLDFESGGRTEIDSFTAYVLNRGKELGVSTPLHAKVYEKLSNKPLQ